MVNVSNKYLLEAAKGTIEAGFELIVTYGVYTQSLEVYKPALLVSIASTIECLEGIFAELSVRNARMETPFEIYAEHLDTVSRASHFFSSCRKLILSKRSKAPFGFMSIKATSLKNDFLQLIEESSRQ